MKILGVSGSPKSTSRTLALVHQALGHSRLALNGVEAEVHAINLGDLDVQFCDGRDPKTYSGDTQFLIDSVCACDGLIIGTPMYRASYTARLKNMFDLIPNDALTGKPVGIVATGGSDHHFLAIEHQLKPVIGFFQGHAIPGAVYANNSHFKNGQLIDEGIASRLKQLGESVARFAAQISATGEKNVGADGPEIKRE